MKCKETSADVFVFESTRIRALENRLVGEERLERLLQAGSLTRCAELLEEFGVEAVRDTESGSLDREKTLERRLQAAYREVLSLTDGADFLKLWLYPYDCNNLKSLIKCKHRGVDAEDLLLDFGTVPLEILKAAADNADYDRLPAPFGEGATAAAKAMAATGDPQRVDLILDRACYSGMAALAQTCGVKFSLSLVRQRIDLTNLITCVRRMRSSDRYVREILPQEMILEGGTLTDAWLKELCEGGEAYFWERLEYSAYRKLAYRVGESASIGQIELAADNFFMEQIREARRIPYGAEPLLGYLLATEYEVKNLRILMSGYSISLPPRCRIH